MSPRPMPSNGEIFEPALERARQGHAREAIEAIVALARESGNVPAAVAALTTIARRSGADPEIAQQALIAAVALAPNYPDLHYRLAGVQLQARRPVEARASLDEALRLNPDYVAAQVERALLDAREGRLGEALETLRRMSRHTAVEEPWTFGRGLESLEHADWDAAGTLLRSALHLDDPGIDALIAEFHELMGRGERAEAARRMRAALRDHEGYADLHYLLGCVEIEESQLDDAIASLARALEIHPDFHAARLQLARALEAQGDLARAEDQVALVLEVEPRHATALEFEARWSRRARGRRGVTSRRAEPRRRAA